MTNQVLRDEYVSPFYDKSVLQGWLEDKPELATGAREIAAAFGVRMAASPAWVNSTHSQSVALYTKEGLPAGMLSWCRGYCARRGKNDMYYKYKSPLVSKQRSSTRSERDERDSDKITGIINAIKKNKEIPTTDAIKNTLAGGISDAYQAVGSAGRNGPSITVSSDQAKALVKYFLEDDKMSIEAHRIEIQSRYSNYLKELEKHKDSASNLERFRKGSKIIGILSDKMIGKIYYLVGDSEWVPNKSMTFENIVRYESLYDSPLAGEAAMIRTYLEGKPFFTKDNEIGVECKDAYFEDIDVAVGYRRYDLGTWVVIPKHGF